MNYDFSVIMIPEKSSLVHKIFLLSAACFTKQSRLVFWSDNLKEISLITAAIQANLFLSVLIQAMMLLKMSVSCLKTALIMLSNEIFARKIKPNGLITSDHGVRISVSREKVKRFMSAVHSRIYFTRQKTESKKAFAIVLFMK